MRERLITMLCLTALLHAILILGLTFTGGIRRAAPTPRELDVLLVTNEVPEAAPTPAPPTSPSAPRPAPAMPARRARTGSPASQGPSWHPQRAGPARDSADRASGRRVRNGCSASTAPSRDIRYFESAPAGSAQPAADMPSVIGDADGPPRAGRGDAMELLLRGKPDAQHWVAPDTQASKLAPYLAGWKRKVERVGTLHFPSAARSAGLSGSPVIEVEIGADGRLTHASVRRSSGHDELDQAALTILQLASPFDPFPADLATEYARLRFAYQWEFVAGALQAGAVTASSDTAAGP